MRTYIAALDLARFPGPKTFRFPLITEGMWCMNAPLKRHPSRTKLLLLLEAARKYKRAEQIAAQANKGEHITLAAAQESRDQAKASFYEAITDCN